MSNPERKFSRGRFLEMMGAGTAMVIAGCTSPPEVFVPEASSTIPSKTPTPPATPIPFTRQQVTIPELAPTPVKQETKKIDLKVLWQEKLDKSAFKNSLVVSRTPLQVSPYLIKGNSLFLTRESDQKFVKVSIDSGKLSWPEPWEFTGTPIAVTENTVWVLKKGEDRLYVLDSKKGEKLDRFDFEMPLDNPPIISNGKIFLATRQDFPGPGGVSVYSLSIFDQETRLQEQKARIQVGFRYPLQIKGATSQYVILTSSALHPDGYWDSFDLSKNYPSVFQHGYGIIERTVVGPISENKILTMNAPYKGGALIPNNLEGYDLDTGKTNWSFPIPTKLPVLHFSNDIILATNPKQDILFAINPNSGISLWTNDEIKPKQILDSNSEQVVVATESTVAAYSKKDGTKRLWKYDLGDFKPNGVNCVGTSFGKEFVFFVGKNSQGGKRLVFRNPDGSQSKPDVSIEFDPKRIVASGNFLIIEGEKDIAVVG